MIVVSIFALIIGIALLFLIYKMAKERNREAIIWVIIAFFVNPLLAIILLLILGKKE